MLAGAAWFFLRNTAPTYNGKPLDYWLRIVANGQADGNNTVKDAETAINAIGTNAIPTLLTWIKADPKSGQGIRDFAEKAERILPALPARELVKSVAPDEYPQMLALYGFQALGEKGAPAIPALRQMIAYASTNYDQMYDCARVIGMMGEAGSDELVRMLGGDQKLKDAAIVGLYEARVETNKVKLRKIAGLLVEEMKTPGNPLASGCARALGYYRSNPEISIPALISGLTNSDPLVVRSAVVSLGFYGPLASNALPEIEKLKNRKVVQVERIEEAAAQIVGTNDQGLRVTNGGR